jgi:ATPase subunit of ABC transporter with duplicated ATPase domains
MIEISVSGLVKSFDLEKKILDGLTFQINTGERVGLLGKNGAGKTTLFRILTGEIDYDLGEVVIAPNRRVGLISQIPVYPEGYTVEDVLRSAFSRLHRLTEEMEQLAQRMADGDTDPDTLKRYGSLSERFEVFGGYDTDVAVNKIANDRTMGMIIRNAFFIAYSTSKKFCINYI